MKKILNAFTLAEVMITLVVIGVVAAVTIPMLKVNSQERINSHREANIVHKLTQAMHVMKANGDLTKFNSTSDFVDVLQKYLKINKRCDANHIAECWPTNKVKLSDGSEYEVSKAKTRQDLGFENAQDNENVGIILADGAHIILTYNPDNEGLYPGDETKVMSPVALPVGDGLEEILDYTTNVTSGLAFITDVNGSKSPNKQGGYRDIRSFNGASFQEVCPANGVKTSDGNCFFPISSVEPVNCLNTQSEDYQKYCEGASGSNYASYVGTTDYWAGSKRACDLLGASLMDDSTLVNFCKAYRTSYAAGYYWTSQITSACDSHVVNFATSACTVTPDVSGWPDQHSRNNSSTKVLCLKNE